MITCTIGGLSIPVRQDGIRRLEDAIEVPGKLELIVEDTEGVYVFTRGQPVTCEDSAVGLSFTGFVLSSTPTKLAPGGIAVEHDVVCMNRTYPFTKRENTQNYLNWYAGDVAVDFVEGTLAAEGVSVAASVRHETTAADFTQGTLSGTAAYTPTGTDGDLELAKAGADLTITENTTATFASGTLTNVQAVNNTLLPTTLQALAATALLPGALAGAMILLQFWAGSMTVGTSDTLNYDIWIAGTSPDKRANVELTCSDGTVLSLVSGLVDQNNLAVTTSTDLSAYAVDQWYTRSITLTGLNGKSVTSVALGIGGTIQGTYHVYVKHVYLGSQSGNPFLSTSATVTNVNPVQIAQYSGYSLTSSSAALASVFDPASSRLSPSYSIDAVKLLGSSLLTYTCTPPTAITLNLSCDGGNSWVPCPNNAALPALPSGSNVAGMALLLKEVFTPTTGLSDPTLLPTLQSVSLSLVSAPAATKSDLVQSYLTASDWNSGTLTSLVTTGNDLTLGATTRDWNDNQVTNQTFFSSGGSASQSASSGACKISVPTITNNANLYGMSRLDFVGELADFTLDIDLTIVNGQNVSGVEFASLCGVTYRQTSWQNNLPYSCAYLAYIYTSNVVVLAAGTNGTTSNLTSIASSSQTVNVGTTYHLKIVVTGTRHQLYFNHSSTACIDVTDTTFQGSGNIGLYNYNQNAASGGSGAAIVTSYDNLSVSPALSGTWQSSAISLNSLGNCGLSSIYWTEQHTSNQALAFVQVSTSIDNGSTFQLCTNGGGIASLTNGMSVAGKSLIVKALLHTISDSAIPVFGPLVYRVLGAYPGSSGTRTTAPLGNDTGIRANVASGFGTGTDGQTYAQVGTGTTDLASDEMQITNTTGDVHMPYGTQTGTDLDGTVRFSLSSATIEAGLELRYQNSSNFFRLSASTTTLSILICYGGTLTTLASAPISLALNTYYYLRFRVVGSDATGGVSLSGKLWQAGTIEPAGWTVISSD